jgi:hypothetical protein
METFFNTLIINENGKIHISGILSKKVIDNTKNVLVKVNDKTLICGNATLIFVDSKECDKFFFSFKNIFEVDQSHYVWDSYGPRDELPKLEPKIPVTFNTLFNETNTN